MIDPFPPCPALLRLLLQPIADVLCLRTLPIHSHEIILASTFYQATYSYLSPALCGWLAPDSYRALPTKTKINWDIHVVSMFNSTFICLAAIWVLCCDKERKDMSAAERIFGYTGAMGMTQAFAAGYFLWDTVASAVHLNVTGPGALAHAISALVITGLGFRPFANYYGIAFILYELSTPLLNIHWFLDKCKLTGSRAQLVNGIALLATFFSCRLLWGTYQSVNIYMDIWRLANKHDDDLKFKHLARNKASASSTDVIEIMRFADDEVLPPWLTFVYLGSNTVLAFLNFYWFGKMIQAGQKRFSNQPKSHDKLAKD